MTHFLYFKYSDLELNEHIRRFKDGTNTGRAWTRLKRQ
jgi:hypothetical protein